MAITLTAAKSYVAKISGLQNDNGALALAADSIAATYRKWDMMRNWSWCLKDTAAGFSVVGDITNGTTFTFNTPGEGDGVNVNVAVTGTGIPASTTVSAVTRNSTGQITAFTLSAASTNANDITATFAGDIPLRDGVNEYNLPTDFNSPYAARLLTNPRALRYIKYREWNRRIANHDTEGTPTAYTLYNPISSGTQGYTRLRLFRTPGQTDTLHLQYYRTLNYSATNLDVLDQYVYVFLDEARVHFLTNKDPDDSRLPALVRLSKDAVNLVMADDEEESEDEDVGIISQMEAPPDSRINYDPWSGDWY